MAFSNKTAASDALIHGPILSSLVRFMIPLIISQIFQQLYNTVDTWLVGHYLGDNALAAIGTCSSVYDLLVGFSLGIGSGLTLVTARCFGSGKPDRVKQATASALVIGVLITALITLVSVCAIRPLMVLLGTPDELLEDALGYISTICSFIAVMFAYNLFSGMLRAIGNSVMPLVFLIISSTLNIGLDILLITRFGMGIHGAAVATVISQGISAVLCLIFILIRCDILVPRREHFRLDRKLCMDQLGQGLSMGLMSGIVCSGSVILQSGVNSLGTALIEAQAAARKLFSLTQVPFSALTGSISTFVSQNYGAGQYDRIRGGTSAAIRMGIAWAVLVSVIMYFFAPSLVAFLSSSSNPTVIENGAFYLQFAAPFYAVLGALCTFRNSLQGMGSKVVPLISSFIELAGKILFTALLIPMLGYTGVIICEPVIWCAMTAQLAWSFYHHPAVRRGRKPRAAA